jgi:hypothetical protein
MTGGLAYILDEDDTLVPKVRKLRILSLPRVILLTYCLPLT